MILMCLSLLPPQQGVATETYLKKGIETNEYLKFCVNANLFMQIFSKIKNST